jgi:Type III secretion system, cytoplasmic E component of needle
MAQNDEVPALELQARLAADDAGEERRRIEAALAALRSDIRRGMDQGVAPAEYRTLEVVDGAAEAAQSVVALAWRRYHGSGTS